MKHSLKRQEYLSLHHIVEQGHKKYLKQSRINKQSAFNILRVLTSYKQIFPSSPDCLYKLIMVMANKYNPQTLDQWRKSIQKINDIKIKSTQYSVNLNQSVKQGESSLTRLRNQQNSVKTYKEQLDSQIDYIQSKRTRLKVIGDYRINQPSWVGTQHNHDQNKQNVMQFSNKDSLKNSHCAHYISFQPNTKENIQKMINFSQDFNLDQSQKQQIQKKINPYYQITRIDNLSLIEDRQPTSKDQSKTLYSQSYGTEDNSRMNIHSRTHRDQSLILKIGRKDSQLSIQKFKIVQTQRINQTCQHQDLNMTLEEWEFLNDRTTTFYQFNTKLKAFSALLANHQALQSDRQSKKIARIFHQSYLSSKVFICLKQNSYVQRIYKQKYQKSTQFHQQSLSNKVFKVLKILQNLTIRPKRQSFDIQKLNRINYQFFISFMFEEKFDFQSSPRKESNQKVNISLGLSKKAEYFSKSYNFQNVWNIYKYFGLNVQITQDQMKIFFRKYHVCLLKQAFKVFKLNRDQRKTRYSKIHDTKLVQKVFSILIGRWNVSIQQKKKLFLAQSHRNKNIQQKTYKILLSIVYSTKIFSKRQALIQSKNNNRIKTNTIKKWFLQFKKTHNRKQVELQRMFKFCQLIQKFILKISLSAIRLDSVDVKKRINDCQKNYQDNLLKKVFKHFSILLKNKHKYIELCEFSEQSLKKNILLKWFKYVKTKQSVTLIQKTYNKSVFRLIFMPLSKNVIKQYQLHKQEQRNIVKQCFEQLRSNRKNKVNQRNSGVIQTNRYLLNEHSKRFLSQIKINKLQSIKARKLDLIQNNRIMLRRSLDMSKSQKFFFNLKSKIYEKLIEEQRSANLTDLIRNSSLRILTKNIQQKVNQKQNVKRLQQYLKSQKCKDCCLEMRRNSTQLKQNKLKQRHQKKMCFNFLGVVSSWCAKMSQQNKKSSKFFIKLSQQKVLLTLVTEYIEVNSKVQKLQQFLKAQRKMQNLNILKNSTQKQVRVKSKSVAVSKRQVLSSLRMNFTLKQKRKQAQNEIKLNKYYSMFNNLKNCVQLKKRSKKIEMLTVKLHKNLFWMRFNCHFLEQLFKKKNIFMAYKFRAFKLYKISFRSWKQTSINSYKQKARNYQHEQKARNYQQEQKARNYQHKQRVLGLRQKQTCHQYKPTDSSSL